jgi:hypothetical protein
MAFTNRVEHNAQCVRKRAVILYHVISPTRIVVHSLPGICLVAFAIVSSKLVQFVVTYNFNVVGAASS